jgi:DNA sulfur modification protein DndB
MGDWFYYVTYLSFLDVSEWIKPTEEVHQSKKLAGWIQRRLNSSHTQAISEYLLTQPERFFNSIVIGVYGGQPEWAPLRVTVPKDIDFEELSDQEEIELESAIGLLKFSGNENLFAIDGQHRVAGIKKAIQNSQELKQEEICALFVEHENSESGMKRTRRLFTTLNKTAKKVAVADIVALDEDDGFAVVTRQLVDEFDLFIKGERVSFSANAAIPDSDLTSITSVIGIYYLTQDLYPKKKVANLPKKSEILNSRPLDEIIDEIYSLNREYWLVLKDLIPEYKLVFQNQKLLPGHYRTPENNHMLFRPIGQRAFASAVQVLIERSHTMRDAIQKLREASLYLNNEAWHYVLWNPIQQKMISANRSASETFLLRQIGEKGRTSKHDRRLDELLKSRDEIFNAQD